MTFAFACPSCHAPLEQRGDDRLVCPADGLTFECVAGIWRMLLPGRQSALGQFIHEYETVRKAEGRGSATTAYYRSLPYLASDGPMAADWRIRAASFDLFRARVLFPMEQNLRRPLRILDMGAGNGWLSNRLARRGHEVMAVDLTTNDFDGLGCHRFYATAFTPLQAEFDHLPVIDGTFDLIVFNASLHYATRYEDTLRESLRVLDASGRLAILDTPFYRDETSGEAMVQERQEQFNRKYGFPSNALASENYLTYQRLDELAGSLRFTYKILTPSYGLGWSLRPWKARLLGRREPAKFHVVILSF